MEWWATQYVAMQCLSFVKCGEKYMKTKNGNQKWQSKIDNPEKLAIQSIPEEKSQSKNTTQYVLDTAMRKQTQNSVNKT